MKIYQSKAPTLPGSSYDEAISLVRKEHKKIESLTKRQPYVRSMYFNKDKIFISCFLTHIMQIGRKRRTTRLTLYNAAIDLLRNSRHEPETLLKGDLPNAILYRFYGVTKNGVHFCVQVKQDKRSGRKDFMSAYPRKDL